MKGSKKWTAEAEEMRVCTERRCCYTLHFEVFAAGNSRFSDPFFLFLDNNANKKLDLFFFASGKS